MKIPKFNLQTAKSYLSTRIRQHWQDILIILILAVLGGVVSYLAAQLIRPMNFFKIWDVWFDADIPPVFSNMTKRLSNHSRIRVHPLFSLIVYPPIYLLRHGFGFEPIVAVRIVISIVASFWLGTLFVVLRLIGCRQFDAVLFSLLAAMSAGSIFWFTIPETYPFGSFTILLTLCFVALSEFYSFSSLWYVALSALTMSFTTTNWMMGILATAVNHRWQQSLQITVNAFALVTALWAVQKRIFPSAVFFLDDTQTERFTSVIKSSGNYLSIIRSFFSHTMIMPAIRIKKNLMITQSSAAGSASLWGAVGVGLWMALLGLGLWGFFRINGYFKFRLVLGLAILGYLGLHLIYGYETFIYSLHFVPLLIILASFALQTPARLVSLIIVIILIICAGINNYSQFYYAADYLSNYVEHSNPLYPL